MKTRLTLHLNNKIIDSMKSYAHKHGISISKLTENIFRKILLNSGDKPQDLTPIVKKYSGIVHTKHINKVDELTDSFVKKHKGHQSPVVE